MAETKQDEAARSQRVIRVKDAFAIWQLYTASERNRIEQLEKLAAAKAYEDNRYVQILGVLDLPTNWGAALKQVFVQATTWLAAYSPERWNQLLIRQSERRFVGDEQVATQLLAKALRQDWPRDQQALSRASRGHRQNRSR